jgi:hypothetical protein
MGITNWIKKEEPILKDWQIKLLDGKNVRKDDFIKSYSIEKASKMDENTFKYSLEFHTKFGYSEQCDVWLDRTFEGVYDLDISNADYLSHFLIPYEDDYFLFINKCGRSHFTVYRLDYNTELIEYDDKSDTYRSTKDQWNREDWEKVPYVFNIRLKEVEFIKEFLENLLQRNLEYKKSYKRELKLKEILK